MLVLHAQRICETFDRMLGGRIHPLQRHHRFGDLTANIDQRALGGLQGRHGQQRAVHHAPEIDLEQSLAVSLGDLVQLAVDRHAGIVDPRVDAAVQGENLDQGALQCFPVGHIDRHRMRPAPFHCNGLDDFIQHLAASGKQDHLRPALGGEQGRAQAYAAGGAGDDDDLLVKRLVLHGGDLAVGKPDRKCPGMRIR